jgi:hypothetical protein
MTTAAASPSPGTTAGADVLPTPTPSAYGTPDTIQNVVDDVEEEEEERDPPEEDLLSGMKLFLAFFAMMLSLFLVALDVVSSYLIPLIRVEDQF